MKHGIFVPLAGNPDALREIDATPAGDGRFRIVGLAAAGDHLQFTSGEIVECEIRRLPTGKNALVAVRSVSADPEYRKRRNMFAVLGVLMGGVVGALIALSFVVSTVSAASGAVVGAIVFGFCSVRWGDDAWVILSTILSGKRR